MDSSKNSSFSYQQELFYSVLDTVRVIIRLNSHYYCPYCWLPTGKVPAALIRSHFIYIFMLWFTASHLWSCPGSFVLIISEILTMVLVTIRSNHDLDSLKYCSDIEPSSDSSDKLAEWQHLLGGIPTWMIITQCVVGLTRIYWTVLHCILIWKLGP